MMKAELERANAELERALKREQAARKQLASERDSALIRLEEKDRVANEALDQQIATSEILRVISGTQWLRIDRELRPLLAERIERGATDELDAKIMALAKEHEPVERGGWFS